MAATKVVGQESRARALKVVLPNPVGEYIQYLVTYIRSSITGGKFQLVHVRYRCPILT
jgi:hypothetical protein